MKMFFDKDVKKTRSILSSKAIHSLQISIVDIDHGDNFKFLTPFI